MEKVVVRGKTFTLDDMQRWFVQIRGFPSILYFGKGKNQVAGEGQSGGRMVTELVREVETAFVNKIGVDAYRQGIDKIMKRKGQ